MEKKKNKLLPILTIILAILMAGLITYIIYNNFIENKHDKETQTNVDKIYKTKEYVYDANYEISTEIKQYYVYGGEKLISINDLNVPYINIDSDDAKKVNQEIYKIYEDLIKDFEKLSKEEIWYSISSYNSCINDNILSIIITIESAGTSIPNYEYYTYNFDLDNGNLLNYEEVLTKFKLTQEDALTAVKEILNKYIINKCYTCSIDNEIYLQEFNKSLSYYQNNIVNNNLKFFIKENQLIIVLKPMTYANQDSGSNKMFNIITKEVINQKQDNNDEEKNNDINNIDVNETDLNEMLKIIGIKSDDYLNLWLNYYLSDENYSQNANLIMSAYINSYEEEIVSRPPNEVYISAECGGGAADCHVISKKDAKRIYEKYNFTGTIEDYFKTSTKLQDKYVFFYTRAFGPLEYDINHNITSKYTNSTDVMITDEQEIININSNAKENKTVTYLFKKNTEGNYYLDNVKINNNNKIEIEDAELVTSLKETINNLELLTMDLKAGWFYDNDKTVIEELDEKTLISFAIRNNRAKIYDYSQKIEDKEEQYTYTVISKENLKNILLQSGYVKNERVLDNLNYIEGCPGLGYSDEYNGYIVHGSYGFAHSILTYDYKLEKNETENEYYLYRSVAYRTDGNKENPYNYTNIEKLTDEEINKDNYNKYSKFKFTFKGNILYSVEKVTD